MVAVLDRSRSVRGWRTPREHPELADHVRLVREPKSPRQLGPRHLTIDRVDQVLEPRDACEELGCYSNAHSEPLDESARREPKPLAYRVDTRALREQRTSELHRSVARIGTAPLLKQRHLEHVELNRGIACLKQALAQDRTVASPELGKIDKPLRDLRRRHTQEWPGASRRKTYPADEALVDRVDDYRRRTRALKPRSMDPVR